MQSSLLFAVLGLALSHTTLSINPKYLSDYNILDKRIDLNDNCLYNNQLAWSLDCKGFNDGPRDDDNNPITDCNICACDNNCKVIDCDNARDFDGNLCTDSCNCTPYCGDADPDCILGGVRGASGGPNMAAETG